MDALGALGSLSTLKQLIPSLSFVDCVTGANDHDNDNNDISIVSLWKIGVGTISMHSGWSGITSSWGISMVPIVTMLISPGITALPVSDNGDSYGSIEFYADKITLKRNVQCTAILFNY